MCFKPEDKDKTLEIEAEKVASRAMRDFPDDRRGWCLKLQDGLRAMFDALPLDEAGLDKEHYAGTPERVAKMYLDSFWGLWASPDAILSRDFGNMESKAVRKYDEMVTITDIEFNSWCAHHLLPFWGVAHFGYIPDKRIVGLSKIPRLVEVFAARPQLQEKLTKDIARCFWYNIKPQGLGIVMKAEHGCMRCRGVRKSAMTTTSQVYGNFQSNPATRAEFFSQINHRG